MGLQCSFSGCLNFFFGIFVCYLNSVRIEFSNFRRHLGQRGPGAGPLSQDAVLSIERNKKTGLNMFCGASSVS